MYALLLTPFSGSRDCDKDSLQTLTLNPNSKTRMAQDQTWTDYDASRNSVESLDSNFTGRFQFRARSAK